MTVSGLVATAIRLFALWVAVFTFQSVGVTMYAYGDRPFWVLASIVMLGIVAIALLWRFAHPIAKRCVPSPASESGVSIDPRGILQAGVCLIGLLTLTAALPELLRAFGWQIMHANAASPQAASSAKLAFIVGFAELLLGMFLLLGSSSIVRFVRFDAGGASSG